MTTKTSFLRHLPLFLCLIAIPFYSSAQKKNAKTRTVQPSFPNEVLRISASLDSFNTNLPPEKLFIHTDKSYYSAKDTIWLKAYLLNGLTHKYSDKSGLLYAELISDSSEVVKIISLPVAYGLSWGQIVLDPEVFDEGSYTLRAYTNWMQNFGEDCFFKKQIYITSTDEKHWLVKQQHEIKNDQINFALQLRDVNDKNFGYKKVKWRVLNGKKSIQRSSAETTVDGSFGGNFSLPDKVSESLQLLVESDNNQKAVVPIKLHREENTDLQFMPEGGYLVAGLPAKVAFKAVAEDGLGTDIEGKIVDSKNNEIPFKSTHNGMGYFYILPAKDEVYLAKVKLGNGTIKTYNLPEVKSSGSVFRVINNPGSDSIRITVLLNADLINNQTYKIMAFSNGVSYYGSTFKASSTRISGTISKSQFPSGIVHFTLFDDKNQPLNERITFINHHDNLDITITPNKPVYHLRDSVSLSVQVKNPDGKAVQGSFSLSVTDDALVKTSMEEDNIVSNFLLSSGLKGYIENPAYYLDNSEEAQNALDLLLLTQGWKGYNWTEVFGEKHTPRFMAQHEFNVSGRVTNILNKPLKNSKVLLMGSGKYRFFRDTVTNAEGRFTFDKFPGVDTTAFFIQARTSRGKNFGVGLEVDEFKPAPAPAINLHGLNPWYVNSDSTLLQFVKTVNKQKKEEEKLSGKNILNTVTITGKRGIKNSKNLNGPGEADQVIDENQVAKGTEVKFLDFLMKNVKGFNLRPKGNDQIYMVFNKQVKFIIDGIDIDQFYDPADSTPAQINQYYDYVNMSISSIPVRELKGVEVMYNTGNTGRYDSRFLNTKQLLGPVDFAYLEITTISGHGPFFKQTPGIASIRPLPISRPVAFYSPKYTPANKHLNKTDYRSTIFWEPNLFSNKEGIAHTSFYSADTPGSYTVIVQGTDLGGLLGYKMFKLKIEPSKLRL